MARSDAIRDQIRAYILAEFLPGEVAENLADDAPLRTTGVLDSLSTIRLVSYLEATFRIEIAAHETGVQDFDRIDDIAALVARKLDEG